LPAGGPGDRVARPLPDGIDRDREVPQQPGAHMNGHLDTPKWFARIRAEMTALGIDVLIAARHGGACVR
jgi:hypothetical protein